MIAPSKEQGEPIGTQTESTAQCDFEVQANIPRDSNTIATQTRKEIALPAKKRKLSSMSACQCQVSQVQNQNVTLHKNVTMQMQNQQVVSNHQLQIQQQQQQMKKPRSPKLQPHSPQLQQQVSPQSVEQIQQPQMQQQQIVGSEQPSSGHQKMETGDKTDEFHEITSIDAPLMSIKAIVNGVSVDNEEKNYKATQSVRNMLSGEGNPPTKAIDDVLKVRISF